MNQYHDGIDPDPDDWDSEVKSINKAEGKTCPRCGDAMEELTDAYDIYPDHVQYVRYLKCISCDFMRVLEDHVF